MAIAELDRRVVRTGEGEPIAGKLSDYREAERYVLLGEPGIGKSTAFAHEAELAGTKVVRAIDFVAGDHPDGRIVFIDALEEYRVGEAGIDRINTLIRELKNADYAGWRIACRAISLPPADALRIRTDLAEYVTLQMDLLDKAEQRALLKAAGERDPFKFMQKIGAFGADALLGNPATLLLLRDTFARTTVTLETREALFAEAATQMSREINLAMPERRNHPSPGQIEAAAEKASLVLLLSVREDIWLHAGAPAHPSVIVRDDLLPGGVDIDALKAAVDTPMFKGDEAGFHPTHRVVAEYLAGRALARAVVPDDPTIAALPLYRALAFCTGDNDRPAPALSGVFAWFVTVLAKTPLSAQARDLIALDPEAVLFHGDAAALPSDQRRYLLKLVGRGDPWFLGAVRGSSAIGGLAGDDLADDFKTILDDPAETPHRRTMVLEALATGRAVAALAPDLRRIVVTPSTDHYTRRRALDGYLHIAGEAPATLRALINDMKLEPYSTAAEVRAEVMAVLVRAGAATVEEVREVIAGYAKSGDGTMGYARALGQAVTDTGLRGLLDKPLGIDHRRGVSRSFEVHSLLNRVLATMVRTYDEVSAADILNWVHNGGLDDDDRVDSEVETAIARWLDKAPENEQALFDALDDRVTAGATWLWRADFDFKRFSDRKPSQALRERAIEAVEAAAAGDLERLARRAFILVQPVEDWPDLYWRLFAAIDGKPEAVEWYDALRQCEVQEWRGRSARRERDQEAVLIARNATDRAWLKPRIDKLREATLIKQLGYAAEVYHGYRGRDLTTGIERVTAWLGGDADLIAAIREGWGRYLATSAVSVVAEGKAVVTARFVPAELMVIAWAEWRLHDDLPLDLSLALAFRVLRYAYSTTDPTDNLRTIALERIYEDPQGAAALGDFWASAIRQKSDDLPERHHVDPARPAVAGAVRKLLRTPRAMSEGVLTDLLYLAAASQRVADIKAWADRALRSKMPAPLRRIWAMTAFLLAPEQHAGLLKSDLDDAESLKMFERLWEGPLTPLLQLANDVAVARGELLVRHLGAAHGPPTRTTGHVDKLGEVILNAVTLLSRQLSDEATEALARLVADPALTLWHQTVIHLQSEQLKAVRDARFQPPAPRDVAKALMVGPPATAADLRAVVRHTLDELVVDLRYGSTSPWRQFWNRSNEGATGPRVENDCRDLVIDRLSDRLLRFGIPVKNGTTEVRSAGDRRADMLFLGAGAAALPVEVKRHWNADLWKAVDDQLHPYTRSAGSNGHGILLVLWFGTVAGAVPKPADGAAAPTSADALATMLRERLSEHDRARIDIVVADVSDPKFDADAKKKAAPKAKPKSTSGPKPKSASAVKKPAAKASSRARGGAAKAIRGSKKN